MKKVLAIVGPTGAGKTALGISLAQKLNGEIISGDSIQVYKGLDIGSAKVTKEEQSQAVHHLIDILTIEDAYSVKDFQTAARSLIDSLSEHNKLPIIVGGTGLYIKSVLYDYDFPEEQETAEEIEWDRYTNEELLEELRKKDRRAANNIHVNNRKRLIRALKMAYSGQNKSEIIEKQSHEMIYDALCIGLTVDREKLYDRINMRVDKMMKEGLKEEIDRLYIETPDLFHKRAMQGIGYREWKDYYEGNTSLAFTVEEIKKHSRQFAKRQYTWFNNQMDVHWYHIDEEGFEQKVLKEVTEWYNR